MLQRAQIGVRELHVDCDQFFSVPRDQLMATLPLLRSVTFFGLNPEFLFNNQCRWFNTVFPQLQHIHYHDSSTRSAGNSVYHSMHLPSTNSYALPVRKMTLRNRGADFLVQLFAVKDVQQWLEGLNVALVPVPHWATPVSLDTLAQLRALNSLKFSAKKAQEHNLHLRLNVPAWNIHKICFQYITLYAPGIWKIARVHTLCLEGVLWNQAMQAENEWHELTQLDSLKHLTILGSFTAAQWTDVLSSRRAMIIWQNLETLQLCYGGLEALWKLLESAPLNMAPHLKCLRIDTRYSNRALDLNNRNIIGGVIRNITINNSGPGYTSVPTVTITGSGPIGSHGLVGSGPTQIGVTGAQGLVGSGSSQIGVTGAPGPTGRAGLVRFGPTQTGIIGASGVVGSIGPTQIGHGYNNFEDNHSRDALRQRMRLQTLRRRENHQFQTQFQWLLTRIRTVRPTLAIDCTKSCEYEDEKSL